MRNIFLRIRNAWKILPSIWATHVSTLAGTKKFELTLRLLFIHCPSPRSTSMGDQPPCPVWSDPKLDKSSQTYTGYWNGKRFDYTIFVLVQFNGNHADSTNGTTPPRFRIFSKLLGNGTPNLENGKLNCRHFQNGQYWKNGQFSFYWSNPNMHKGLSERTPIPF